LLTVVFDLTVAVEAGLMLACGFFIYRMAMLFRAEADAASPVPGVRVVRLYGSLFFGAVGKVEALSEALPPATRAVVLEMHQLVSMDTSGVDALEQLQRTLARQGVALHLCALNAQPLDLLQRAGFIAHLGEGRLHADLPGALAATSIP
jgi:SulP family sulfate permease